MLIENALTLGPGLCRSGEGRALRAGVGQGSIWALGRGEGLAVGKKGLGLRPVGMPKTV